MRQLRGKHHNAQRIDESRHHRTRDKTHELGNAHPRQQHLDDTGRKHRRHHIIMPILVGERGHHQGNRTGRCGNHGGPPAGKGDGHRHNHRRIQPHPRVEASENRKA